MTCLVWYLIGTIAYSKLDIVGSTQMISIPRSFSSGEENISLGVLQLADGASCAGNDECILVLENCKGFDKNSF